MTAVDRSTRTAAGQVTRNAAEVYQQCLVPALFAQWCPRVADAAGIAAGQRVLDVACGTGVLAHAAAARAGASGAVVGLDINPGMLEVARQRTPAREAGAAPIEWREAAAERLPFDDGSFDVVVSQFGLMFFSDRAAAIAQMARVLRRDGRLAVAVWDRLAAAPGFAELTDLLQQMFGDAAASALRSPFCLGDSEALIALFGDAALRDVRVATHEGVARFDSIEALVHTEFRGWTLSELIDDSQYERLLAAAQTRLRRFAGADGRVAFPMSAHIVTAVRT